MPEILSISVNGQSQVPTGFRFHPTEEELLRYYLRNKVSYEKIDLDVIRDVDQNKLELWDIKENCKIGTTPQQDWYFFSHKDKKYPTGTRTNRATAAGFWKATGRDKVIYSNGKRIGMRKTFVFYKGRAPHGQKSDWIMHEYRLDDNTSDSTIVSNVTGDGSQEEGWVVCRIFKKKNHLKIPDSPLASSATTHVFDSCDEGALEQILQQMGRSCKEENEGNNNNNGRFARSRGFDSVAINNNNGYLDRLSTTKSDQEVISSIPCHAVFMFLDPLLLGMLQIEYQSKPNSPFETHPVHMWTFLTAICIYSAVLAIKIYVQNHSSYYAQILSHVLLVAGALSSASLVSIFLPRLLEWFLIIIWASMPVIMARRWLRAQLYWVFSGIMNSISQAN